MKYFYLDFRFRLSAAGRQSGRSDAKEREELSMGILSQFDKR